MKKISLFQAIATLLGATIGAGILGLPYVFKQSGLISGTIILFFVALTTVFINLMIGEVALRTKEIHQLSGYVGLYLGAFWHKILGFFFAVTLFGALLAYFIGAGESLANIFGGQSVGWSFLFYILGSIAIFFGLKFIKRASLVLSFFVFLIFILIIINSFSFINLDNLSTPNSFNLFMPLGVLLFAYSGSLAIPTMRRILIGQERKLKKSLIIGSLLPGVVYLIFSLVVIGVSGSAITEVATIGLGQVVGPWILILGSLFSLLTMSTAFITVGLSLKDMFIFDWKMSWLSAWFLTIIMPLIGYFCGLHDFIKIIGLAGSLGFGAEGLIYLLTYWQARKKGKRKPEYVLSKFVAKAASGLIFVIFGGAFIYTVFNFLA